ncbi:MAG: hypothetical protein CFE28_10960 [Alphaproteobacteria bacterium PA2]|nr:MAG: hypothetical protein CFE28_10960 [Alphaproteobacteria bacterium PA2]
MSSPFKYQGLNLTGWSKTAWADHSLVDLALAYIKSTGANFVPVDWPVNFKNDGSIVPAADAASQTPNFADLSYVVSAAHDLGLKVFLKPHVTLSTTADNRNTWNTDLTTFSADLMFRDWSGYLTSLASFAQQSSVEGIVIGTEMNFIDTSHRGEWAALIANVRAQFTGLVTYDALFNLNATVMDVGDVVFWDLLDAISVSLYVPLSQNDNASAEELLAAWTNNPFGDIKDVTRYLSDLSVRYAKPVIALEGGYQSVSGGLFNVTDMPSPNKVVNTAVQNNGLAAYLSALEKYAGDWFAGVSLWQVTPELMTASALQTIYNTQEFSSYQKPAAATITNFYTGVQSYQIKSYVGSSGADIIYAGTGVDTVYAGSGSDIVASGSGADTIYQSGLTGPVPAMATSELRITGIGGILDGVAPKISVFVNGVNIGSGQLTPVEANRGSDGQSLTGSQTLMFNIPSGMNVETLKVTLDNDEYKGSGQDRNFITQSIVLGGVALLATDTTYYPLFDAPRPGTWMLYQSGYIQVGLAPYLAQVASTKVDNDKIRGGSGYDIVVYGGRSVDFSVTYNSDDTWLVSDLRAGAPEGVDHLTSIEMLRFSDKDLVIGVDLPTSVDTAFRDILRASPSSPFGLPTGQSVAAKLADGSSLSGILGQIIKTADNTTSVATLAYQFFTGATPGAAGMDYLVSPTGPNANNLNSAYYQSFSLENRYINFAVNLGKAGAGQASFQAGYGSLSLADALSKAYATIFGSTPSAGKVDLLLNGMVPDGLGGTETRAQYFAFYGQDGVNGLGTKAAMVGWLLGEAVKADLGSYALANDAFLTAIANGTTTYGVNLIGQFDNPSYRYVSG